jgi:hypothetical protein
MSDRELMSTARATTAVAFAIPALVVGAFTALVISYWHPDDLTVFGALFQAITSGPMHELYAAPVAMVMVNIALSLAYLTPLSVSKIGSLLLMIVAIIYVVAVGRTYSWWMGGFLATALYPCWLCWRESLTSGSSDRG